jgi:hypothetical protein
MSTKSTYPTPSTATANPNPNPNPDIDADRERQRKLRDQTQRGDGTSVFVPGGARSTSPDTPTPLAPFPGTRTSDDDDDPFEVPTPREGGETPPVMITQDLTSPGRTISTNYVPGDEFDPNNPGIPTPGNPGGGPGGGTPPEPDAPVVATVAIDSPTLLALSGQPKLLVPITAGDSLEFQGATGQFTFGTVPYTGAGVLQVKCGGTVVSDDVAITPLTGSVSGPITFTALPGIALAADQPITLAQSGGALTGGDGTLSLDVTTVTHHPAPAGTMSANSAAQMEYDRNSRDERARAATHGSNAPHEVGRIGRMMERGERHSASASEHASSEAVKTTTSRTGETHPKKH